MLSPALSVIPFSSEFLQFSNMYYISYYLRTLLRNCWILIVGHLNHIKGRRSLSHNDISGTRNRTFHLSTNDALYFSEQPIGHRPLVPSEVLGVASPIKIIVGARVWFGTNRLDATRDSTYGRQYFIAARTCVP